MITSQELLMALNVDMIHPITLYVRPSGMTRAGNFDR